MPQTFSFFFLAELTGTVAFACSGAMVAIEKKLDLLGVIVLGVTTAVGGGMIRDILLGQLPPNLFINPAYVLTAFLAVLILFFIVKFCRSSKKALSSETYEAVMNLLDAIGLGVFTAMGIDTAIAAGYGGGILRDIMAGQTPFVLKKHVYACASLAGALSYVWLLPRIFPQAAFLISAALVVLIRVLARHYKWNLPTAE